MFINGLQIEPENGLFLLIGRVGVEALEVVGQFKTLSEAVDRLGHPDISFAVQLVKMVEFTVEEAK